MFEIPEVVTAAREHFLVPGEEPGVHFLGGEWDRRAGPREGLQRPLNPP